MGCTVQVYSDFYSHLWYDVQTVCYEIFRDIIREARQFDGDEYRVMASQIVIDMLLDEEAEGLEKLQEFIQKPIHLQVEPLYHQEVFDVVLS